MKYLAILGSHKRDGITGQYLDTVLDALPASAEKEIVFLRDYDIYPDTMHDKCPALDAIEAKMAACDVWVIAAPTYWSGLSGVMKYFFDCMRFRMVRMTKKMDTLPGQFKNKHYVSLTTCFTSSVENFVTGATDQTFVTIDRVMTSAGLIKKGEFVGTGTWQYHELQPKKIQECQRLAQKIAHADRKDDETLKRYILLFGMIAVTTLITMGIQNIFLHLFSASVFWLAYISFVLIFFLLLAGLLHFFTFVRHRRR